MEIDDVLVKRPGGMLKMPKSVFEKLLSEIRRLRLLLRKADRIEKNLKEINAHLASIRYRLSKIPPSELTREREE